MKTLYGKRSVIIIVILLTVSLTIAASGFILSKCRKLQYEETEKLFSLTEYWLDKEVMEVSVVADTISEFGYTKTDSEKIMKLFRIACENNNSLHDLIVVFNDNSVIAEADRDFPEGYVFTDKEIYVHGLNATVESPYVSGMYFDSVHLNDIIVTICAPVFVGEEKTGVVIGNFAVRDFYNYIDDSFGNESRKALVVDKNGNVMLHDSGDKMTLINKTVAYDEAGIDAKVIAGEGYHVSMNSLTEIHSSIKSDKYGYYAVVVTSGFDYYGSVFVFLVVGLVIFLISFAYIMAEETLKEKEVSDKLDVAYQASRIDYLTGIYNRAAGEKLLRETLQSKQEGMYCCMDIDKFKLFNDCNGHDVGDKVLKAFAKAMQEAFTVKDIVARFGGDEFVAFAVGVTDKAEGEMRIQRMFDCISEIYMPELKGQKVSVSVGACLVKSDNKMSFEDLYTKADKLLYKSKLIDGNCVSFDE